MEFQGFGENKIRGGSDMLLYPGTGMGIMGDAFRFEEDILAITTLKAEDFGGEHNKRSYAYVLVLWLVGIWSMMTNLTQVVFVKVFKRQKDSFMKILWNLGRDPNHVSSFFVDRFSKFNHQSKTGAASWPSLDIFYNYHTKISPQLKNDMEGAMTRFWVGKMENRQAVTNRLKIVINLLENAFRKFVNEPEIRLVSIASGSAQAVIKAIQRCCDLPIKVILIDIDKTAIKKARQEVELAGLTNQVSFIHGTTSSLEKVCQEFRPHIVEMVGFLDYRPKKKAIQLIHRIKDCLLPGGYFLTCNIRKNRERIFLNWTLLWPMIYRSEKQFAELLVKGGFLLEKINIFYEPFKIHGIGVCQK